MCSRGAGRACVTALDEDQRHEDPFDPAQHARCASRRHCEPAAKNGSESRGQQREREADHLAHASGAVARHDPADRQQVEAGQLRELFGRES